MDYSQYSDEELMQIASGQNQPSETVDYSQYSDEELMSIAKSGQKQEGSLVRQGLEGVVDLANELDSYTGAPTRASIRALQKGEDPIGAFGNQFGEDNSKAPTGSEIASEYFDNKTPLGKITGKQLLEGLNIVAPGSGGVLASYLGKNKNLESIEFEPTAADLAGFGIDVVADPTTLIPLGLAPKAVKGMAKGGMAVAKQPLKAAYWAGKKIPVAGKGVEVTGDAIMTAGSAVNRMFNPKIAPDYDELLKIADANGIDRKLLPEAIEFGEESVITQAMRNRAEGPLGEEIQRKFNQGLDAVRSATKNKIAEIGDGSIPSRMEAGEILRSGYDKGLDNLFSQVDWSHKTFMNAFPGAELSEGAQQLLSSKLNGLEKWAIGQAKRGITQTKRTQAQQILNAVRAARSGGNYKQAWEALREIGDVAFKTKNTAADIPPDIEKLRDLYFTLDKALLKTVDDLAGKEIGDILRSNNEKVSKFLTEKSIVSKVAGDKNLAPEKVFSRLVENGDTRSIQALREILPEEHFKKLKSAFLDSRINENADGIWTFKGYHNRLRTKRDVLETMLDAQEVMELDGLLRLGSRFGNPKLSSSGTGGSVLYRNIREGVRDSLENDTAIRALKSRARNTRETEKINQGLLPPKKAAGSSIYEKMFGIFPATKAFANLKDGESVKGRTKWTLDGFSNLLEYNPKIFEDDQSVSRLFKSTKAQKLMQEASGLKPGSKRMKAIYKELEGMVMDGSASN